MTGVEPDPIVGGEEDEHGCIPSAGEHFCATTSTCIHVDDVCPHPPIAKAIQDPCGCHAHQGWNRATQRCEGGQETDAFEAQCCANTPGGRPGIDTTRRNESGEVVRHDTCFDGCGCLHDMGWSVADDKCMPGEETTDFEVGCCQAGMLTRESTDGDFECEAQTCEDYKNEHVCNSKSSCTWDGDVCTNGGTCCDYFEVAATRIAASNVLGTKGAMGEAMALCDSMSKCSGIRKNADGSFSATEYTDATTEPGNPGDLLLPKGQCKRIFGAAQCAEIRSVGGAPPDLDECTAKQAELQDRYTHAVEKLVDVRD